MINLMGGPTKNSFENLDATKIMGIKADERLGFGKGGPHHAS